MRFRRCNARRSRSRCCARRRTGRPALASWGPRSCRSSGNSPTSGPSSSRSTTSTGSTVPRRRRSSSRCGACPPSGCGRSSPSGRVRPALWPGSSVTALWSGSSSVRSRSPRCTASSSTQLGRTFPRPTLVRIAQASGGNPLYALEIARLLERDGERDPGAPPRPREPAGAGRVARSIAAPRAPATHSCGRLRSRSPISASSTAGRSPPAEEAGLVRVGADERIEFVHPLFASAVYSSAPLDRRRETHRALADVGSRSRGAGTAPGARLRAARRAGGARGRGRCPRCPPARSAGYRSRADRARAPPAARGMPGHRTRYASTLPSTSTWRATSTAPPRCSNGSGAELEPGDLRARALLALAEIDYWRKGESAATALAEEGALAARRPAWCRHAATQRSPCTRARSTWRRPPIAARAALALLDGLPGRRARPRRGGAERPGAGRSLPGRGLRRARPAERALALERRRSPGRRGPARRLQARPVAPLRRRPRRRAGTGSRRPSRQHGTRATSPRSRTSCSNRMIVETWAGEWGEAEALAERMADAFAQQGVESEGVGPWRAYVDAHVGRFDVVRAAFEQATSRRADRLDDLEPVSRPRSAGGRGREGGRPAPLPGARRARPRRLPRAGDLARGRRRDRGGDHGRRARAGRVPHSAASRTAPLVRGSPGAWPSLRAAAASSSPRAEISRAPPDRWSGRSPSTSAARCRSSWRGRCSPTGQVLRRLKRKRQARTSLEEALAIFRRLGAEPWVRRAEAELARVAVRRAPDELSATELRIAQLAAAGSTERGDRGARSSSRARPSRRTSRRVYRKLDIRSRAQLARALDAQDGK